MKYYSILFVVSAIFVLVSCQDFLEQEPGTQTSISEQLSTYQGFLDALNGCYLELEDICTSEKIVVYADALGGNFTFTPTPSGTNKGIVSVPINIEQTYSFADNAYRSEYRYIYNDAYAIINATNLILENINDIEATETQINQIKAEALTIRAYTHFIVAQLYSQNYAYTANAQHLGIVYNEQTIPVAGPYPVRETAAQTYSLIMDDFQQAIELYTGNNALQGTVYTYFNAASTKAMLARVALQANKWQQAANYATEVIESGNYALMSNENYISEWEKPDLAVSEIIVELSVPVDDDGTVSQSNTVAWFFGYVSEETFGDYVASGDLLALFDENDIRGQAMFIEKQIATLIDDDLNDVSYFFSRKFQDNPGYPLIRLSEMYLIRAEANARLDNTATAITDLNIIRQRAGLDELTETDELLDEIFTERRRELCFEGHLLFDIARFQKDVVRNEGCLSSLCNLSYPSNYFVLPIPQENINLNSNLKQNEGYY